MLKFVLPILLFLLPQTPVFATTGGQPATAAVQPPSAQAPTVEVPTIQATLQEIIAELAGNQVTDARYSEELRAEIKRQRDFIVPTLTAAGPLKSLTLLDTSHPTPDRRVVRFLAEHEQTSFEWTMSQNSEGVVTLLVLAPPRVPATPEEKQTALAGATLTEIIAELRDAKIDEARYSKALVEELKRQHDIMLPTLVAAGPLVTLKFLNATRSEAGQPINQFLAEHEGVKFLWTISMNKNDVVTLLIMQPGN